MKVKIFLLSVMLTISLGLVSTPASWANELTFQGVTFDLSLDGSGDLLLTMSGLQSASGNWTGISSLESFAINNYGTATGLAASGGGVTWSTVPGGMDSSGCNGNGTGWSCFSASPVLQFGSTDSLTFTITPSGGAFDLSAPPELKVLFDGSTSGDGHGSILSLPIPATTVPEPASVLLLGAGFVGIGMWRRKAIQL